jgi:hypothetical protein
MRLSKRDRWLVGGLAFLSLGGLYGGVAMMLKPDGSLLRMPVSLLQHSLVTTYRWPGVFLLLAMGLWPACNIYGVVRHTRWAALSNMVLGATTVVWIMYETATIRTFSPLQPIITALGIAILYGGYIDRMDTKFHH